MRKSRPPLRNDMKYLALLLTLLISAPLWAESFQFSANSTKVLFSEGEEFTELSGSAEVISGSVLLKADKIVLYGDAFRFVECTGEVIFKDEEKELALTARRVFYDRETKRATAQGQVIMEDTKESLVARAVALEIGEDASVLVFKAGVRIFRDDLMIRAELVQFQRDDSLLQLRGFPIVYWGTDEYRAMFIQLNIDTEEVELVGEVSGNIIPDAPAEEAPASGSPGAETVIEEAEPATDSLEEGSP